ncbi:unnamed protein product [Lactuca virosa]|uniref:Raptor N-terminal CASPase-like domain-containing protein n=1 Tax=Lactuca virosa TaxID=75947 RepID=A0AAU9PQE3_9ASTR|nr:unnamed protein product [Lactuca virosa]
MQYALSKIRNVAIMLLTPEEKDPQRIFEGEALLRRMNRDHYLGPFSRSALCNVLYLGSPHLQATSAHLFPPETSGSPHLTGDWNECSSFQALGLIKSYTQYIPLPISDLDSWLKIPSIYVFDCSAAGMIVNAFIELQNWTPSSSSSSSSGTSPRDCILLAACEAHETLCGMHGIWLLKSAFLNFQHCSRIPMQNSSQVLFSLSN